MTNKAKTFPRPHLKIKVETCQTKLSFSLHKLQPAIETRKSISTMSGFISEMIGQFTHSGHGGGGGDGQQQGGYGGNQQYQQSGPPQLLLPWVARWDNNRGCWIYINQQTGEETLEHPGSRGYGGYPQQQQQYQGQQGYGQQQPPEKHGHGNMALGAAAGLVGGAALMYEGEKIRMFFFWFNIFLN